jgi:hypothetical protein
MLGLLATSDGEKFLLDKHVVVDAGTQDGFGRDARESAAHP